MGGDVLTDGTVDFFVHFIHQDHVHLTRWIRWCGEEQWVKVPVTQWRDEVRRSSVFVVSKFL